MHVALCKIYHMSAIVATSPELVVAVQSTTGVERAVTKEAAAAVTSTAEATAESAVVATSPELVVAVQLTTACRTR